MKQAEAATGVHRVKVGLDNGAVETFASSRVIETIGGGLDLGHEGMRVAQVAAGRWLWYKLEA